MLADQKMPADADHVPHIDSPRMNADRQAATGDSRRHRSHLHYEGASLNKKAQLTMTNLRDAKACRKLFQFDVKTSCKQVNDLFEVLQQPSAPAGESY